MELRQLKSFVLVAETLSFSKTAEILNFAQCSISDQIRLLENERVYPDIVSKTLLQEPLIVISNNTDSLAQRDMIEVSEFNKKIYKLLYTLNQI